MMFILPLWLALPLKYASGSQCNIFNGSVWKCTQGHIEAVPCEKAFVGLG